MNKKAIIFLILFILSFFVSLFLNFDSVKIPYFNGLYKDIQTDIIFKKTPPKVFYDNEELLNYLKIDTNHYLYKLNKYREIKKISFDNYENIEKLIIYEDNKANFISDIQKEIDVNNNKTLMDKLSISLLSFFYNPWFYIISYIFLFLFLYNFKFKYKTKAILCFLLLFSLILRLTQINSIPFWDDEIYVLAHTNNFLETLKDPGNPPLYFIFFKIYRTIVQNPEFYRFSSVILGVLFNYCFYVYLKSFIGFKKALIALFIVSVNIVLIYYSQELRSYMLLMLLALLNSYLLFKFKNKTKFYYLFSSLALLYTHFYGAFLVLYNFFFGISVFAINKNRLKNFLLINLFVLILYIPLLIYKKQSIETLFNSWINYPVLKDYLLIIQTFFGSVLVMLLFLAMLFVLYKKAKIKNKLFIKYNLFSLPFVIILALIVTYLIKPIFFYKYFYVVFAQILALMVYIVTFEYKNKYKILFSFFFAIVFMIGLRVNHQNLFCNHNIYFDFIKNEINKNERNYIFASDTIKGYKEFESLGFEIKYIPINEGINTFKIEEYNIKKPCNVYLSNLYLDEKSLDSAKNIELYKSPLGVFLKIKF